MHIFSTCKKNNTKSILRCRVGEDVGVFCFSLHAPSPSPTPTPTLKISRMQSILLRVSAILLLIVTTLNNLSAKPLSKSKINHKTKPTKVSAVISPLDALEYLDHFGYNPCGNGTRSDTSGGKKILCQSSMQSQLKTYQTMHGLPPTGILDSKTLALMNKPRCGVKDNILLFKTMQPW